MPSALAVLRLMINSNFVDCWAQVIRADWAFSLFELKHGPWPYYGCRIISDLAVRGR